MTFPIVKTLAVALALAVPLAAEADSRAQLLGSVRHELRFLAPGVDPESLSTRQLALIKLVMHSNRSQGAKSAQIDSILGGRKSLFGTLRLGFTGSR
jgi:hypothetical protein